MTDTKALAKVSNAQAVIDEAQIDPRLIMAAKAIQLMAGQDNDGNPKVSADMALAAAMYQAGTGQLLGRDFYVNEKIGRMEGYRGVSRDAVDRGVGEVQIKYRPLTADEAADHEIAPGDTAVACEVYQLRAWRLAQSMGQRYDPIVGIGVVRKIEKYTSHEWKESSSGKKYKAPLPESQWKPVQLEGGMTWRKKAQNRAYKEALRHVPGALASAGEILEEAALRGVPQPPETARLTVEQAEEWVRSNGPDWDAIEADFEEEQPQTAPAPTAPTNGNTGKSAPQTPATFPTPASDGLPFPMTEKGAVDWAMAAAPEVWPVGNDGYIVRDVVKRSFENVRKTGVTGEELGRAWIAKVAAKKDDRAKSEAIRLTDAELDGEQPQF